MIRERKQTILITFIFITLSYIFFQLITMLFPFSFFRLTPEQQYRYLVDEYKLTRIKRLLLEEQYAIAAIKQKLLNLAKNNIHQNSDKILFPKTYSEIPQHFNLTLEQTPIKLSVDQSKTFEQLEAYMVSNRPPLPLALTDDEKQLLALPPNHYTLQLLGVRDIKELVRFVKDHHFENQGAIFHTYYLNKDWYVLVYGHYQNHTEALKDIESLPNAIRQLKPWIRQIASVHKAILLYRNT